MAWLGNAGAAESSTELLWRLPAALIKGAVVAQRGTAALGGASNGAASRGTAWADDLSAEGYGSPR